MIAAIKSLISQILDPGNYTTMQILRQFKDGKPKSWRELQANIKVSTATLSKSLNALTERGVLVKRNLSGFPPRTQYTLNPSLDKDVYNFIINQARLLDAVEYGAQTLLDLAEASAKMEKHAELFEKAMDYLQQNLVNDVLCEVKTPIYKLHPSWHGLLATLQAYIMLLQYYAVVQALTVDPKMQSLAVKLLGAAQKGVKAMPAASTHKRLIS
jgi:predicted transcriptional regulator